MMLTTDFKLVRRLVACELALRGLVYLDTSIHLGLLHCTTLLPHETHTKLCLHSVRGLQRCSKDLLGIHGVREEKQSKGPHLQVKVRCRRHLLQLPDLVDWQRRDPAQ